MLVSGRGKGVWEEKQSVILWVLQNVENEGSGEIDMGGTSADSKKVNRLTTTGS